jgi:hypothetical protein
MKWLRNLKTGLPEHPHPRFDSVGEQLHAEIARDFPREATGSYCVVDVDGRPVCGKVVARSLQRSCFVLLDHLRGPEKSNGMRLTSQSSAVQFRNC